MATVRTILGELHDSQFEVEARRYARIVKARRAEDEESVQEFLTCGHVAWAHVLKEELEK